MKTPTFGLFILDGIKQRRACEYYTGNVQDDMQQGRLYRRIPMHLKTPVFVGRNRGRLSDLAIARLSFNE
jgi:hypothetical protein